jgi:hypothetical protein
MFEKEKLNEKIHIIKVSNIYFTNKYYERYPKWNISYKSKASVNAEC